MTVHTGEKLLKCPDCPYECAQNKVSLTRHIDRHHPGERLKHDNKEEVPFLCNKCPGTFPSSDYLKEAYDGSY